VGRRRDGRRCAAACATTPPPRSVDYMADRDIARPTEQRGYCRVIEDTMTSQWTAQSGTGPSVCVESHLLLRRPARAGAARAKNLDHVSNQSAITCAPASVPITRGQPTLDWHLDQQPLDAEAATDGWVRTGSSGSVQQPPPLHDLRCLDLNACSP
jgi:hypothetical protein